MRQIAATLAVAIQCMHDHNICHSELSPENILLNENLKAKISVLSSEETQNSQELVGRDLWSLGEVIYYMLEGAMPWLG